MLSEICSSQQLVIIERWPHFLTLIERWSGCTVEGGTIRSMERIVYYRRERVVL